MNATNADFENKPAPIYATPSTPDSAAGSANSAGAFCKSEWRGLTTAERKVLWNLTRKPSEYAELIEAKLKEKNHE